MPRLNALHSPKIGEKSTGGVKATELLAAITERVIELQQESAKVLEEIEGQLVRENIHFLRENEVTAVHADFLTNYFLQQVSPALVTVILKEEEQDFSDNQAFLAIKMLLKEKDEAGQNKRLYAFIENAQIGEPFCGAAPPMERNSTS